VDYLPLFHNLKGRTCLLVGGGQIALRKARLLCAAGAQLRLVSPEALPELLELLQSHQGQYIADTYQTHYLQGAVLVVSATDDAQTNRQVSEDCFARALPVNVVDTPSLCSVITPAIVDRSPIMIAFSSGGEAPVLARMLRAKIEAAIPASFGRLAGLASRFRERAKQVFADGETRRRFWEAVLTGPIAEKMLAGQSQQAEQELTQALDNPQVEHRGEVYLVGAGPGDPDLLTFKALRLMQQAEVVLYDRLVSEPIMNLVRRDAQRIYVGKRRQDHALEQTQINQLLLQLAQEGKRVLRLKGGDPFIFGRGGEEIELLAEQGIPFQVVPGITAASGCAAYAGIPLTHRDFAQSVRFITGHLKDGSFDLPWDELISNQQTLVIYMGLVGLPVICEELIAHGKPADTPCALIEKGTRPEQRVHLSDLAHLPQWVASHAISAPTLLIIGQVAALHKKLRWFGEPTVEA
jgi:uroporphyrin-III C-methyltransferase / precorrin-2 dehydrogenase / sirohydrochlorin ferrochelatase